MTKPLPPITIAIPNLNGARFLKDCIESIISQQYPSLQLFFCDGGSSDESLAIANSYKNSFLMIESRHDTGPAEAINRALIHATGDVFHWINSDDILEPGALHAIGRAFQQEPNASVVTGTVINFRDIDNSIAGVCDNKCLSYTELLRYCCGLRTNLKWHQPGCWWKRTHLVDHGGISNLYKAYFDRELFFRLLRPAHIVKHINHNLVRFRFHDDQISHSAGSWKRQELHQILKHEASLSKEASGYYNRWLRSYYWHKRLRAYEKFANMRSPYYMINLLYEALQDPRVRLRPKSGTKKVLSSLLLRM